MIDYHGNAERCPNCLGGVPEWMERGEIDFCSPFCEEQFNLWMEKVLSHLTKKEQEKEEKGIDGKREGESS